MCVCVCVCVCVCLCVCVCVCVCERERERERESAHVYVCWSECVCVCVRARARATHHLSVGRTDKQIDRTVSSVPWTYVRTIALFPHEYTFQFKFLSSRHKSTTWLGLCATLYTCDKSRSSQL